MDIKHVTSNDFISSIYSSARLRTTGSEITNLFINRDNSILTIFFTVAVYELGSFIVVETKLAYIYATIVEPGILKNDAS